MTKNRIFEECKHGMWLIPCPICKESNKWQPTKEASHIQVDDIDAWE